MKEPAYVPLRLVPCDLILRPGAGATVQGAFANARALAAVSAHAVIVEGNDVQVVVRPGMSEGACQQAYEDALDHINARTAGAAMSTERDALIAALVQEYAGLLARGGRDPNRLPDLEKLWYRRGGRDALRRVASLLGITDLHERATEVVAHAEGQEGR